MRKSSRPKISAILLIASFVWMLSSGVYYFYQKQNQSNYSGPVTALAQIKEISGNYLVVELPAPQNREEKLRIENQQLFDDSLKKGEIALITFNNKDKVLVSFTRLSGEGEQ